MDPRPLTKLDRCDACSAQAHVRLITDDGGEWLFCNHHDNQHRSALWLKYPGLFVDDQSEASV
ncbi:DUF7455 domain-containing protein [Gryllotalpicola koreensis]|uniref:DUF7455 domain-containing protein n=1 Tax=Gryllotalpicola koreensis TaxID=993086 RepID=UPI003CD09C9A